ncbi:MAG: YHS domain-containing protein [Candidatus Eisenbacteria bacterium]|nr:YHS domain-containing protein [Candidatus Eisenbacteria bacterium]
MRRFLPILVLALVAFTSVTAQAKSARAAYDGYCPVAYVEAGKAVKGDSKFTVRHEGHRIRFVSADAKKMFEANPAKYNVAYDGWCATAVAMGKKVKSDPTLFTVHNGTTYLFSNADAKKMFDVDADMTAKKADEQWASLR